MLDREPTSSSPAKPHSIIQHAILSLCPEDKDGLAVQKCSVSSEFSNPQHKIYCNGVSTNHLSFIYPSRHEVINVNLKYKPKWFLERNPHGLVPILEFNKSVLYESSICDDFLDEVYPHPKLTSNCPFKRAQDKILMFNYDKVCLCIFQHLIQANIYFCSTLSSQMLPNFYKLMTPDEDQRKKGREGIQSMLIHMEKILGDAPYFGGRYLMELAKLF